MEDKRPDSSLSWLPDGGMNSHWASEQGSLWQSSNWPPVRAVSELVSKYNIHYQSEYSIHYQSKYSVHYQSEYHIRYQSEYHIRYQSKYNIHYQSKYNIHYQSEYHIRYQSKYSIHYQSEYHIRYQTKYHIHYQLKYSIHYQSKYHIRYQSKYNIHYQSEYHIRYQSKYSVHYQSEYHIRYQSEYHIRYQSKYNIHYQSKYNIHYQSEYHIRYQSEYHIRYQSKSEAGVELDFLPSLKYLTVVLQSCLEEVFSITGLLGPVIVMLLVHAFFYPLAPTVSYVHMMGEHGAQRWSKNCSHDGKALSVLSSLQSPDPPLRNHADKTKRRDGKLSLFKTTARLSSRTPTPI
ncbi:hypothetical protein NFI96_009444 [Prochilodus magdalenae]|nr:hypothetical protein NFI96_009444 [Prochilodus magdalenae]